MINLKAAITPTDFEMGKALFQAYAHELQVDLSFQDFTKELANLDKQYTKPHGSLFIAYSQEGQKPVGCFGIRKWDETACELKRMYVKQEYRGYGIGKILLVKSLEIGKELGYEKMRLDTLPSMAPAINLYQRLGFYEIPPYRFNPIEGTKYFEKNLHL